MADIKCPTCGGKTIIRTAKKDDLQYFVCVNYPRCKGVVPAEEDWGGGGSPKPKSAQDGDRERLAQVAEEDWSGGWGEISREPEAAHDSPPQRKEPSPVKTEGGTAVRKSAKAKRGSGAGVKRPGRKGRVPAEESWGGDWGDEIAAPKPAPDRARRHVAPKPEVAPEKKEPPKPRPKIVAKKEEQPQPQRQKAPKGVAYRPLYKKGLEPGPILPQEPEISKPAPDQTIFKRAKKWETVPEEKGREESQPAPSRGQYRRRPKPSPVLPYQPEVPKPAPYRPQYQRPPRWGTIPEENEQSGSQGPMGSQSASYRPQYRRMLKPAYVPPQGSNVPPSPPYRPLFPRAEKRRLSSMQQEPPRPRRRRAPKVAYEEPRPQKASEPAQDRPQQPKA